MKQGELFDFGDEKKRKVEETVLKIKEKNPDLKITKARLLTTEKKDFTEKQTGIPLRKKEN